MNDGLTDIHIRWNNGQDLIITISPSVDTIGTIKQLVNKRIFFHIKPNPKNNLYLE
jgi:hypothetical protein